MWLSNRLPKEERWQKSLRTIYPAFWTRLTTKPQWWGQYKFFRYHRNKTIHEYLADGKKPPIKSWRLPYLAQYWIEGTCRAVERCFMRASGWGMDIKTYERLRAQQDPSTFRLSAERLGVKDTKKAQRYRFERMAKWRNR